MRSTDTERHGQICFRVKSLVQSVKPVSSQVNEQVGKLPHRSVPSSPLTNGYALQPLDTK